MPDILQSQIKFVQLLVHTLDKRRCLACHTYRLNTDFNLGICGGTSESTLPCFLLLLFAQGKETLKILREHFLADDELIRVVFALKYRIGMEILKLPAGRLATVFYKAEPQDFASERSSTSSGGEKGAVDEDLPPMTIQSRQSGMPPKDFADGDGHIFAWKDVCVDIDSGGSKKRLLDDLDGKCSSCHFH